MNDRVGKLEGLTDKEKQELLGILRKVDMRLELNVDDSGMQGFEDYDF